MKNKIKKIIMTVSFVLLIIVMTGETPVKTEAKVKDGTYCFPSWMVTKFQVKNNRLTLKVSKAGDSGITRKNDKDYKKYKFTVKASKNCKYILKKYDRLTGESNSKSVDCSDFEKLIARERFFYNMGDYVNVILDSIRICQMICPIPGNIDDLLADPLMREHSLSRMVVKNNQAVKIVYSYM